MKNFVMICVSILLVATNANTQDQPGKESKEEALYKGKPASFWIKQLKDKDTSFRLEAVKALREIGTDGEGVVLALATALADKEQSVQDAAREAIGNLPAEGKIPALIQILRGKDRAVRSAVIELLAKSGTQAKDAVPELTKALVDEDAAIRSRAANALGKIGVSDKAALTALIKLFDDKDSSVRLASTKALGEIGKGTEVAVPSLIERLSPKKEEDAAIRLETIKTLWTIGKQNDKVLPAILVACSDADEQVSKLARKIIADLEVQQRVPILAQSLKTDDNKTRLFILQLLFEIGGDAKGAVDAVAEVLKSDDETLRIQATKTLGKVGKDTETTSTWLIGLLVDKSAEVRREAANALKTIPIAGKLPALIAALKDKNAEIRAYAVGELEEVGPDAKAAVPALITLLQEKSVRVSAAKAIGKIGLAAKDAIADLAKLLDEDDEVVRTTALAALRNLGPEAQVPVLIGSLRDKEPKARRLAVSKLAELGPAARTAIPALARTLNDSDADVCSEAAMALKAMGKEGVPPLLEFLKSKNENRVFAVRALGEIGPDAKAAIPVLEKLLAEDNEVLKSAATTALRNLGPEARFSSLIGSLEDRKLEVSASAAKELGMMGAAAKSAIPALVAAYTKAHSVYQKSQFEEGWQILDAYGTALKRIGTHDVPLLLELLTKNKDKPLVVALIASTLAEIGLPDAKAAVPVLSQLLQDRGCRVSAALALARLGGSDAKTAILPLVEAMKSHGADGEGQESYLAAKIKVEAFARQQDRKDRPRLPLDRALAELKRMKEARDRLLENVIRIDNNKRVQRSAAAALLAMGKEAVPALLEILKGGGAYADVAAIVLAEIYPEEARNTTTILTGLLRDEKNQHAAAYALGKLGGPKALLAVPLLVDLLGDGEELPQEAAAAIIKNIGKDAVPQLIEILKDKDRRILAIGALGEIGADAKAAAPLLLKLLQDDDCREAAALALGRIGGPDAKAAIPILKKLLEDGDELMQHAAAVALGKAGKESVPALLEVLKDKEGPRYLAAFALGEIGPDAKAAIPTLISLLEDDDKVMRMTAATALGKLGPDAIPKLMTVLKGESEYRFLAIHALGGIGPEAKSAIPLLLDVVDKGLGKEAELAKLGRDAKPRERRYVFLNPALRRLKTFDALLEADPEQSFLAAVALAKIGGANSKAVKAAIPVLIEQLAPRLRKAEALQDEKAELKDLQKEAKRVSFIGPVLQALRQEAIAEDECRNEESYAKAQKKEAQKILLLEEAAISALKTIGEEAVAPLVKALKENGTLPAAIALARINPDAAQDLEVFLTQPDRGYRQSYDRWDSPITDENLREFLHFKRLAGFNLDRTKVTNAGMTVVSRFKNLSKLSLDSTDVTNAGLKEIASLDGLKVLELGGTRVTDAGLKEITKLKNLSTLDLGGTKITDGGLSELAKLTNLSRLGLAYTDISDAGLKELANFKNLTLLDLRGTQVKNAAVEDLRKALPRATIYK